MPSAAERIRKFGFKRWYERTLIESHAYLVTAFLGMILAFAAIELIGEHSGATHLLLGVVAAVVGTAIVGFGIQRYYRIWMLAESFGDRATCPQCRTYAAFNVTAAGSAPDEDAATAGSTWLKVKCRKCGADWTM